MAPPEPRSVKKQIPISQFDNPAVPASASNVVAIAAGDTHSLFRTATDTGPSAVSGGLPFVRAQIPRGLPFFFRGGNDSVIAVLRRVGQLQSTGTELSGTKALLAVVLELRMPFTLERDDVLHGFLYGSESLVDLDTSSAFLQAENLKLQASPNAAPQSLTEVALLRYQRFAEQLNLCLTNLPASGQPEIPRLVGHTLRLLNLLHNSWATVPPPALELGRGSNTLRLVLYGEPYAHYTLQYRDSLSLPGWTTTTMTNWHNEQLIVPPVSGTPQRYYRGLLPTP